MPQMNQPQQSVGTVTSNPDPCVGDYSIASRMNHNKNRFKEVMSEQVTYQKLGGKATIICASPINLDTQEVDNGTGAILTVNKMRFGIDVADLVELQVDVDTPYKPAVGDYILRADGSRFVLTPVPQNRDHRAYQYTDSSRDRYLVYTQQT